MNEKLIKAIKEIPGVKTVSTVSEQFPNYDNTIIVIFKPEQPVLHDEYGVPLFEGDKYWWVNTQNNIATHEMYELSSMCIIDWDIEQETKRPMPKTSKIFSSKESAERWIEENKPRKHIYVDDDGVEFFEGDKIWYFNKLSYIINSCNINNRSNFHEQSSVSKIFKTKKECIIGLCDSIKNKYRDE